jgi:hypothetical protein
MAGYIGSKAVLLSTTAATVTGAADIGGDLTVDTDTLYVDATNNRVGIGTSSPLGLLTVQPASNSTAGGLTVLEATAGTVYGALSPTGTTTISLTAGSTGSDSTSLRFLTSSSGTEAEAMRIDSAGNMLVGTTDNSPGNNSGSGNDGIALKENGSLQVARTDADAAQFNRLNSDGDIVVFRKDGTTVGSIGSRLAGSITTSYINFACTGGDYGLTGTTSAAIIPSANGTTADNVLDLGVASVRFDDIFATNGTIQTSDANEKQDIAELDEAEKRVAVAAKGLIRKYRWKDAVAEKGDDARIHVGIIAQDLQATFAAEGLDAGRYAMFISSTWWEADEVIPAVDEVLDDEGNVVTEAQPERTVTHHYETAEEAPEGATERTRLGVRYPELLAFIIGAM